MAAVESYQGSLDTAEIVVERLDDGRIGITIDGADATADWIVSADEARHIAAGIVTVIS